MTLCQHFGLYQVVNTNTHIGTHKHTQTQTQEYHYNWTNADTLGASVSKGRSGKVSIILENSAFFFDVEKNDKQEFLGNCRDLAVESYEMTIPTCIDLLYSMLHCNFHESSAH